MKRKLSQSEGENKKKRGEISPQRQTLNPVGQFTLHQNVLQNLPWKEEEHSAKRHEAPANGELSQRPSEQHGEGEFQTNGGIQHQNDWGSETKRKILDHWTK